MQVLGKSCKFFWLASIGTLNFSSWIACVAADPPDLQRKKETRTLRFTSAAENRISPQEQEQISKATAQDVKDDDVSSLSSSVDRPWRKCHSRYGVHGRERYLFPALPQPWCNASIEENESQRATMLGPQDAHTYDFMYGSYVYSVKSNQWSIINAAFWLVELLVGYMLYKQ